ncbi:UDP-3-O-acyl-N-acetylglucosamine deacetylase [Leptospirillum ferriphilum]|jgi:UDP-3-O-[3-hydroxymyristoyl] N-acetylglucosamine deacetylase
MMLTFFDKEPEMRNQRTLKKAVHLNGVSLHSGKIAQVRILPAPPDSGIQFIRTDQGNLRIPALIHHVSQEKSVLSTTLEKEGVFVQTIEHLMSAINGFYLDNLNIEIDGPELPILDGSSIPYLQAFRSAGAHEQSLKQSFYTVSKVVEFEEGEKKIRIEPSQELSVEYSISFGSRLQQSFRFSLRKGDFESDIAHAKTFCFLEDIEKMQSAGLAKGGSMDNAIIIGQDGVINPSIQTYQDEFVRHKILDFLGDIRLLNKPLVGRFSVSRGGHAFHSRFLSFLLEKDLLVPIESPNNVSPWIGLPVAVPV